HLVVGGVAVLHAQVVIVDREVEEGEDQLLLNQAPNDAGHLVPVDVDDRVGDFDLCHEGQALRANLGLGPYSGRRGGRKGCKGAIYRAARTIARPRSASKSAWRRSSAVDPVRNAATAYLRLSASVRRPTSL